MTTLPFKFLDRNTLENMKVGEERYTLPWAMWVDSDMKCLLHPTYPAERRPGGTVQMLVRREEAGFVVRPPAGETYQPSRQQPYVGGEECNWLAVIEVL